MEAVKANERSKSKLQQLNQIHRQAGMESRTVARKSTKIKDFLHF
jgi:hypothetical protein